MVGIEKLDDKFDFVILDFSEFEAVVRRLRTKKVLMDTEWSLMLPDEDDDKFGVR